MQTRKRTRQEEKSNKSKEIKSEVKPIEPYEEEDPQQEININEWMRNYDAGKYDSSDIDTQMKAGWFDWFCEDKNLLPRLKSMIPMLKECVEALGEDFCSTHYLMFKNNCPMQGDLYDDFRIVEIKTGDVSFTIAPRKSSANYYSEVLLYKYVRRIEEIVIKKCKIVY